MNDTPSGIGLFKVYAAIMTALYAGLTLMAVAVPLAGLDLEAVDMFTFLIMGLFSFPFMLFFAYGLILPRTSWAWGLGVAMIMLGLTSCCFWPICIPLVMKWFDPSLREWFQGASQSAPAGEDGW